MSKLDYILDNLATTNKAKVQIKYLVLELIQGATVDDISFGDQTAEELANYLRKKVKAL